MKLSTLIEEVVAPHRNFGVAISVALSAGETAEPVGGRNPAILYGLGNLLENAIDFAHERVEVAAPGAVRMSPSLSPTMVRASHPRLWTALANPMSQTAGGKI